MPRCLTTILIMTLTVMITPTSPAQTIPRRATDTISPAVETIYKKGLEYLSKKQNAEGYWPDDIYGAQPGVIGLAILAFLAHGEDPNHGPFAKNIKNGIDFLLKNQNESNGYIGTSMYNHGFATLALAECYGMYRDPRLAEALEKAVDLILSAQKRNPKEAWRYSPDDTTADTTVAGCQIVALYAARNAGIPVPETALIKAMKYMDTCRTSDGSYGYTTSKSGRQSLAAIGSLCYSLAKKKKNINYKRTTKYLQKNIDYKERNYPFYFEYYMSQALFHANDALWEEWNQKNIRYLSVIQASDGSFNSKIGKTCSTASALLSLALNYRFLPIYEK